MAAPTPIILDCDPGHDDAIAMLLAWGSPAIDLIGVTTVAGNQTLSKVANNALSVARVAGITGVPFAAGCAVPIVRPLEVAAAVHGESGLDGPNLPKPTQALDPRHAVDLIIDLVFARPAGEVTIVATGPLTNIALAFRREPRLAAHVREVVIMGGAIAGGNWTPCAEFNIAVDPEAAEIVFAAGWKVTMVGLDVTHRALATEDVKARIAALGTRPAKFVNELLEFFAKAYLDHQGFTAPPVHDVCAVARVINPNIIKAVQAPITVETQGKYTTGMTIVDLRYQAATKDCKTWAANDIDTAAFWDLVIDALQRIGDPA